MTAPRAWRIILIEALRQAVSPMIVLPNSKNRHRAGWRFLRFTLIVTVNARRSRLTAPRAWRIILIEALRQAVSPMIVLPNSKNRHRAGWRFLRFTMIVTVNAPICNVIRMASPPPWGCGQPPAALQRLGREYHNPAKFTSAPEKGRLWHCLLRREPPTA